MKPIDVAAPSASPIAKDQPSAAWATRAHELADWAMKYMVNRVDAYGQYLAGGGSTTAKDGLTIVKLTDHFTGKVTIGLHAVGKDNVCRFAVWDFDQHDEADPAAVAAQNLEAALALFESLRQRGMHPLLEDSDGKGGIHVWVLFDHPCPAADVHAWAKSIAPAGCEAFPKQTGVAPTPGPGHYGNYIRIPGRHHKRDHWSRFYMAGEWHEGEDAIRLLLDWSPSDAGLIPVAVDETSEALTCNSAEASTRRMPKHDDVAHALRCLQQLHPRRADDYDEWIHVGMSLHNTDPSGSMCAEWDNWSRQSPKYKPGECADKWRTFDGSASVANTGGRRLTIATLVMMAKQDAGAAPARSTSTTVEQAGPHGIVFVVSDVTRTPAKFNARFEVSVDGAPTDMELVASDTPAGVREAQRQLSEIFEAANKTLSTDQVHEVSVWLKKLLTRASLDRIFQHLQRKKAFEHAQQPAQPPQRSMQEIAAEFMRTDLDLRFLQHDPMAVWSERLGVLLRQSEFASRIEPGLLTALESANDYAAPTPSDPTKPIKHAQQVLKPVWCIVTGDLPREINANLGPDSKAAAAFRRAIHHIWLTPETWMKIEATGDEPGHVERMSLASRVRSMINAASLRPEQWQRVLKGVNAFFRVGPDPSTNETVVWLGMRADLCQGEIKGRVIHGIETQHDLAILANRYGVTDTTGVSPYITDDNKRQRLVVLNREMCDYLIQCADGDDIPPLRADVDPSATEVIDESRIDTETGEVLDAT